MEKYQTLPREFYLRGAEEVARELLGKYLVREAGGQIIAAELTEVEAYLGIGDRGSHSHTGIPTPRTQVQYGEGGRAYIYLIYGMYHMFNVVTGPEGVPGCVLVREGTPVAGREQIARLRFQKALPELTGYQRKHILDGPGKFCTGLGLTREHNGLDLCGSSLTICQGEKQAGRDFVIDAGKRINIDYAGEDANRLLRFTMRL